MSLNFDDQLSITEAEMSPSAFSGALQQGEVDRVLVGFEFEFCMPKSKIKELTASTTTTTTSTEEEIFQQLRRINLLHYTPYGSINLANFNKCFKVKSGFRYPTLGMGLRGYIDATIDKCIKIFYEIPEEERARISKVALKKLREQGAAQMLNVRTFCVISAAKLLRYKTDQIAYLRYFCQEASRERTIAIQWSNSKYKKIIDLIYGRLITYKFLLYFITGASQERIVQNPQDYLDIVSIDAANNILSASVPATDSSYMDYAKAVSVLCQSYVKKTPIIFIRRHERPKNLVDWYIEPDGSVIPTVSEHGGELVSPPFRPAVAMDMLKQFYAMSVEGQFNVSKARKTGLHINVSIPKKIDLLKLAIFTADDRILTQFNRQNYDYAVNVMNSLKQSLSSNTRLKSDARVDSDKVLSQIESIAKGIMKDHTASISSENKNYISFRSVGFDYLSPGQFKHVVDAVGRFVRAIIIASDPDAYRSEYLKKLQDLLETNIPKKENLTTSELINLYRNIKQNGIPAIKTIAYLTKNNKKAANKIDYFGSMLLHLSGLTQRSYKPKEIINTPVRNATDEEKNLLTTTITASNKPANINVTVDKINDPVATIKTVTLTASKNPEILIKIINMADSVVKLQQTMTMTFYTGVEYLGYGGWGLVQPTRIPITDDPATTGVLKYLKSQIKKSKETTQKLNLPEMIQEETPVNKIYYFAYGMLTDESKMKHLNAKKIGRAVLSDFKLELLQHANIVKESGSKVVGVLWEIDKDAQDVLDQIEGYPVYYNRIVASVKTDTDVVDAEVYIMTDQSRKHSYEHGYPTQRYVDDIVRGYRAAQININQLITALNELNSRLDDEK